MLHGHTQIEIPETRLSDNDIKLIIDVVLSYGYKTDLNILTRVLRQIFLTNINPDHYLVLGYLIGVCSTTEQMEGEIIKSLQLCQRQN